MLGSSSYRNVSAGVPQGSVLGPILFLVFIDDMPDDLTNTLDLFADDGNLWATIKSTADRAPVAASLNRDLESINSWALTWLVTFNLAKSDLLTISRKEDCAAFRNDTPILLDTASTTTAPVVSRRGRPRKTAEPKAPQPLLEYCLTEHPHPPIFFGGARLTESASIKMVGLTVSINVGP